MRVVVEYRPIQGDKRYRVPGVPSKETGDGAQVPRTLYPVVLTTEEGELTIGVVGPKPSGWAWYSWFGSQSYLRGNSSAEAAVRQLLHTASGLKRKSIGAFHKGVPVVDHTP